MTLIVHTARIFTCRDRDRLDITRTGRHRLGVMFAPSDAILWPAKREFERAQSIRARALGGLFATTADSIAANAEADRIERATWERYREAFEAEMDRSEGRYADAWEEVELRDRVVFCCACVDRARCHRSLVAARFVRRGATDGGELP